MGHGVQISHQTRMQLHSAYQHASADRPHAGNYISDNVSGVTTLMVEWRSSVGGEGQPQDPDSFSCPSDSAGFYWSKMGMAKFADRTIGLERHEVLATRAPNPHNPASGNPPVRKIYYHSENFRDASAIVNYPAAVGHPNVAFNGCVARCIVFAQTLAVTGEPWFQDAHGTLLLFPEGRQPRRD